jgi:hypothetical protein
VTTAIQRFTKTAPCPICGSFDHATRGQSVRCFGFLSSDGQYAHCTREEHAGGLEANPNSQTYAHRLIGECRCGTRHNPQPQTPGKASGRQDTRQKTEVAAYDYQDEDGALRHQAVRYRYDDNGEKTFRLRRPDGSGGWIWRMEGVERLPYRLPELLDAPDDAIVFVTEGEADADNLASLGLVATCNSEGAGKFRPELAKWFKNRRVALTEDNDSAGRDHVAKTATTLYPVAA